MDDDDAILVPAAHIILVGERDRKKLKCVCVCVGEREIDIGIQIGLNNF